MAPALSIPSEVRDAVAAAIQQLRRWTLSRVERVNAFTSSETLAAGESLGAIVTEARAYVSAVQSSLESVAGGGGREDAIGQIEAQSAAVARYLADTATLIAHQDQVARDAVRGLASARKLGTMLASISGDARLLAINARIEAAHIRQAGRNGSNGAAFDVIATEMSNFAKAVHVTNEEIVAIVERLAETVQEVAESAAAMQRQSTEFSRDYAARSVVVGGLVRDLRATVTEALSEGDTRIARVIHSSQDALSHLQFQDACAQQLLLIDADIGGVERVVDGALRGEQSVELTLAESHRVLSAGHVAVFDDVRPDASESPAIGDVLLF